MVVDFSKIDPKLIALRCKRCESVFSFGEQLDKHRDRNRDLPPGTVFIKCPHCGKTETVPDLRIPQLGKITPAMPAFVRRMMRRLARRNPPNA